MKIIFLDIDGVLNGYNKLSLFGWKIISKINYLPLTLFYKRIADPFSIHELKVKRLAKIINKTNAKVVLSSSWRYTWWNKPYEKQYEHQKKLTNLLNKYNIEIIDVTPKLGLRGEEINNWLFHHKEITNFVILDDEASDMGKFKYDRRFIQTSDISKEDIIIGKPNENTGLKNKHVRKAIKILMER